MQTRRSRRHCQVRVGLRREAGQLSQQARGLGCQTAAWGESRGGEKTVQEGGSVEDEGATEAGGSLGEMALSGL